MAVRCAIYTRKSTDEGLNQEFNSLDAQREACLNYIQAQKEADWQAIETSYDDPGFTGSNTERPALQQLVQDIQAGKVDNVVVYKVDRLSRSLHDFVKLIEVFEKQQVTFVSVTQQFNTTSSMGRLTLNVLLSFAQFEREVISERTRDKLASAKSKGLWTCGTPPLGYRNHNSQLEVVPKEAELVRLIFELFTESSSATLVARKLTKMGYRTRTRLTKAGKRFGSSRLNYGQIYRIVRNLVYLGKVCYKGKTYPGKHPAIVSPQLWNQVQSCLKDPNHQRRSSLAPVALLSTLMVCSCCQRELIASHAHAKQNYRYYRGILYSGDKTRCQIGYLQASRLEATVLDQLKQVLTSSQLLETLQTSLKPTSSEQNSSRSACNAEQIKAVLAELFEDWDSLTIYKRRRMLKSLVQQIIVHPHDLELQIKLSGLQALVQKRLELAEHSSNPNQQPSELPKQPLNSIKQPTQEVSHDQIR